jgi:hypothetical protein
MTVPVEAIFKLELLSPISTETNKKGDEFSCRVLEPQQFQGAIVSGHITKLKSSGKANKKSEIALAFDTITFKEYESRFDAEVKEVYEVGQVGNKGKADQEGTVQGASVKKRAWKRAATGGLIGIIIGAILGGGQGAIIGGAIGAGIGMTSTLAFNAPNLEFKSGTQFDVQTTRRTNAPLRKRDK